MIVLMGDGILMYQPCMTVFVKQGRQGERGERGATGPQGLQVSNT